MTAADGGAAVQMVQDVVGYVNWLNDPSRSYMPKAENPAFSSCNLGAGKEKIKDQPMVTKQQAAKKTTNKQKPLEIGSLKGCCLSKNSGSSRVGKCSIPQDPTATNSIAVSVRILFFEGVAEEDAVELLKKYVRDIPDAAFWIGAAVCWLRIGPPLTPTSWMMWRRPTTVTSLRRIFRFQRTS